MTTVWGITDIKEIGISSWTDKHWIINPEVFNNVIANRGVNDGNREAPGQHTDHFDPVDGYEISEGNLNDLSAGIVQFEDYNTEQIQRSDTAWQNDSHMHAGNFQAWNGSNITGEWTEFFKLFWKQNPKFTDRGFTCFGGNCFGGLERNAKNWIYVDLNNTSYTGYLRIFYRTWQGYYNYIRCQNGNLDLNVYNNNQLCKGYIRKNWPFLSEKCLTFSDNTLFSEACNDALANDNTNKSRIMKKRMDFCKSGEKLLNDSKCKIFLSNKVNNLSDTDKLELDTWVINNMCGTPSDKTFLQPSMYNEFCACINEKREGKKIEYKDANNLKGELHVIPGVCNTIDCQNNNNAYKLLSNENALNSCPKNICIQNQELKNLINSTNISQSCNITDTTTTTIVPTVIQPVPIVSASVTQPTNEKNTNNKPMPENAQSNIEESKLDPLSQIVETILPGMFPIKLDNGTEFTHIHFIIIVFCILYLISTMFDSNSNAQIGYNQYPMYNY